MKQSLAFSGQRGFVAIELMFALIVIAIMMTVGANLLANRMDSQNYQIAAQQQQQVADAAAKYLKDNFTTVYAAAGTTTPAKITPLMLRNTNYLPAGFGDTNAFGQNFVILARRVATNQLESIVITTGGQTLDEIGTREIAEDLGAPGGFIPFDNTSIIQGVRGGWQLALGNYGINPGIGHTVSALFLQDGNLANDYLYRNAIPNHPELNRMNAAIDMNNNDINNAGSITATGNVTAEGDVNADSVNAQANVTGVTADMSGETYTAGWFRTRGDTGWYSEKWGGGWYMSDSDWVRVYGNKNVYTPGQIRGGNLLSDGRATVGEYLQLNGLATEGAACSPNGLLGRDANGLTLSCQSGLWKGSTSKIPLSGGYDGYAACHRIYELNNVPIFCAAGEVAAGIYITNEGGGQAANLMCCS